MRPRIEWRRTAADDLCSSARFCPAPTSVSFSYVCLLSKSLNIILAIDERQKFRRPKPREENSNGRARDPAVDDFESPYGILFSSFHIFADYNSSLGLLEEFSESEGLHRVA